MILKPYIYWLFFGPTIIICLSCLGYSIYKFKTNKDKYYNKFYFFIDGLFNATFMFLGFSLCYFIFMGIFVKTPLSTKVYPSSYETETEMLGTMTKDGVVFYLERTNKNTYIFKTIVKDTSIEFINEVPVDECIVISDPNIPVPYVVNAKNSHMIKTFYEENDFYESSVKTEFIDNYNNIRVFVLPSDIPSGIIYYS